MKKAGNIFIPDSGRRLIVFLDDIHLAVPDQSESISFLELLTMQLKCHYWFNRQNWKLNHILVNRIIFIWNLFFFFFFFFLF